MNRVFTIVKTRFTNWPDDGQCRPKHVAPLNLNKLDVLDVKCSSLNIELQHIGMSSIKLDIRYSTDQGYSTLDSV